MLTANEPRFRIELLAEHDRTAFSSGVEALDTYLRRQAGQDARRDFASVYLLIDVERELIAGYYTLNQASILKSRLPAQLTKGMPGYPDVPATLVGRLAVDRRYQGQGFGRRLLLDALRRARETKGPVAAAVVVVDAKDDAAREFYRRFGFQSLIDDENRLVLPMARIAGLLTPES